VAFISHCGGWITQPVVDVGQEMPDERDPSGSARSVLGFG